MIGLLCLRKSRRPAVSFLLNLVSLVIVSVFIELLIISSENSKKVTACSWLGLGMNIISFQLGRAFRARALCVVTSRRSGKGRRLWRCSCIRRRNNFLNSQTHKATWLLTGFHRTTEQPPQKLEYSVLYYHYPWTFCHCTVGFPSVFWFRWRRDRKVRTRRICN